MVLFRGKAEAKAEHLFFGYVFVEQGVVLLDGLLFFLVEPASFTGQEFRFELGVQLFMLHRCDAVNGVLQADTEDVQCGGLHQVLQQGHFGRAEFVEFIQIDQTAGSEFGFGGCRRAEVVTFCVISFQRIGHQQAAERTFPQSLSSRGATLLARLILLARLALLALLVSG